MAANEIHVGDIGTIFEVTLKDGTAIVDVSGATAKSILLTDADNVVTEHTAAFKTDGVDGVIQYVTIAADLANAGGWKIQGRVTLATGTWSSDIAKFKVHANLD